MVEQRVEKYEIHSYYKNQNESETKKRFSIFEPQKIDKVGSILMG